MSTPYLVDADTWAYAYGKPQTTATFKASPADFVVVEQLGFEPSGDGQHLALLVRKTGANTSWVATQLASAAGIDARNVGYAGQKDRFAVTTQWFTLDLAGKPAPDWSAVAIEGVEILQASPHRGKLKRGTNAGNHFTITLRDIDPQHRSLLLDKCQLVQQFGVPNYYGLQRFGRYGDNVAQALLHLKPRGRKGLASNDMQLSALRSYLFNVSLSQQVRDADSDQSTWATQQHTASYGQQLQLDGSNSRFTVEATDDLQDLGGRLRLGDVHHTLPLWSSNGEHKEYEQAFSDIVAKLAQFRLGQDLRATRIMPRDMVAHYDEQQRVLSISFALHAGQYATSVLREITTLVEPQRGQ